MGSYLDRYLAGDREKVWSELDELGDRVQQLGVREDAWAVACETMRRARKNVETLFLRLKSANYQFEHPEWMWIPATAADADAVRELESLVGPMPMSLRAWYEFVGSVWWTGSHPEWKSFGPETDALVMNPVSYILEQAEEWLEDRETRFEEYAERFHAEISPDRLHKADISGGPPYAIACGVPCADGLLKEENRRLTFVPYLRVCFKYGGFPGFEGYAADESPLLRSLPVGLLDL